MRGYKKKIFFKSMFKEGRDLGMLMISANWLGLGRLLWKKGNQTKTTICLEAFHSSPLPQRFDALLQDSHTCMLSAFCSIIQPPGPCSPSPPARAQRAPAERRLRRRCPRLGDNGKPQLGAALAPPLSPSTATQGAPPRQSTTSRSSPGDRKWLDRF